MSCNDITYFALEFNLFGRFKTDHKLISNVDLLFTYIYFIIMGIYPFIIIIHKLEHYYEDHDYCENHKNVHSCRNITFPNCVFDIIIHIFTLKIFIEFIFLRIVNLLNFINKYDNKILPYEDNSTNNSQNNTFMPDNVTRIEDFDS